ncbi:MAG TPA: protein phosphatase 2C domain-containing protein [Niabella sp.]|nr:protein phosphatase 2C domain-containing protein [Niabella sp.]
MFFRKNIIREKAPDAIEKLICESVAVTDKGPLRANNEDTYKLIRLSQPDDILVAMVADGMGGHNAGEEASYLACEVMSDLIQEQLLYRNEYGKVLEAAIHAAHAEIQNAAEQNETRKGMGCTLTCALIANNLLYMAHVGDSRLYFWDSAQLKQLSDDQTIVNEMFKKGKITEEEKDHHEMKNILMQALGSDIRLTPQIIHRGIPVKKNDCIFLCTDGVHDVLKKEEIKMLMEMEDIGFAKECLSALAYKRNVADNFSAIILKYTVAKGAGCNTKELNAVL